MFANLKRRCRISRPGDISGCEQNLPRSRAKKMKPLPLHFWRSIAKFTILSPSSHHINLLSYTMTRYSATALPLPRAWRSAVDSHQKGRPVLSPFHATRLRYGSPRCSALKRNDTSIAEISAPPSTRHRAEHTDIGAMLLQRTHSNHRISEVFSLASMNDTSKFSSRPAAETNYNDPP